MINIIKNLLSFFYRWMYVMRGIRVFIRMTREFTTSEIMVVGVGALAHCPAFHAIHGHYHLRQESAEGNR